MCLFSVGHAVSKPSPARQRVSLNDTTSNGIWGMMPASAGDAPTALKPLKHATPRNATRTTSSLTEGLYLLVRSNSSKLWRFKYRFGGKEKLLSFGDNPREKSPIVTTFVEAASASHANRLASFDEGPAWLMFRRRGRRPVASWSWTKFRLQRWFCY